MTRLAMNPRRVVGYVSKALLPIVLIAVLMGCYWTDGSEADAGLTLEIVRDRGDGLSSQEIVDPYGFLFAYVIEESVLLGGTDAIIDLFDRLEREFVALDEDLEALDIEDEESFQRFIDNYRFDIEFPSAQFQGQFITFQRGASGRNTFRGLNAGVNYLVVVEAFGEDYEEEIEADAIGFSLTTVRAGENRSVTLELGDNYDDYFQFLAERYRFAAPDLDEELGTIVLDLGDLADFLNIFENPSIGAGEFFFDLIDGELYDEFGSPTFGGIGWSGAFDNWYERADLVALEKDGFIANGSVREDLADYYDDGFVVIEGLKPDRTWRLLITTWNDRETAPGSGGDVALSEPFSIAPGETEEITTFEEVVFTY